MEIKNSSKQNQYPRILVIEDHKVVQIGIETILEKSDITPYLYFAPNFEEGLKQLRNQKIDIIILEISIFGECYCKTIELLKTQYPSIEILVFSKYDEDLHAFQCLRMGAKGYISKSATEEEFISSISMVLCRQIYLSEKLKQNYLTNLSGQKTFNPLKSLSSRETEVMNLLAKGHTTSEISKKLFLQPSTISTYKNKIYNKLKANNNIDLINRINTLKNT